MDQAVTSTRSERSRQIMAVLAAHGLAAATAGVRISRPAKRARSRAQEAREACEELGTTFIKMGQLLSTRGDVLPSEYRDELSKLQDSVPPLPAETIEDEIANELGARPQDLYKSFDREPLASASIGQVHLATLHDGRAVVVKVRKPGVRETVELDLEIIASLADKWSKHFPALADHDVDGMVAEFSNTLRAELDYAREAKNIAAFREYLKDDEGFYIPEVIEELSTGRVLTLTLVEGVKAADMPALPVETREAVAERVARLVLEPAFLHGNFHADPHPGNIVIREDGVVGVVDFGMIGHLTDELRRHLADLFMAIDRRDVQRLTDRLIDVAPPTRPMNRSALSQDLARLLERYMSSSLERVQLGNAINELLDMARRYGLQLPGSVALFFKAMVMSEGLIAAIDPGKTIQDFIQPIADKVGRARMSSDAWADRLRLAGLDAAELSIELPRRADRVLADVERGNLRVWAKVENLEPALARMERMVERVNITLIAAACIVGLAVLTIYYHPQGWHGVVAVVVWVAIVIALVAMARIAWSTLRKGG